VEVKITEECTIRPKGYEEKIRAKKGEVYDLPESQGESVIDAGYGEKAEAEEIPDLTEEISRKEPEVPVIHESEELGEEEAEAEQKLIEAQEIEYEDERFRVYEEKGVTKVANMDEDTEYEILPLAPSCECKDFQIRILERGEKSRCKHLEVAEKAGYTVGEVRRHEAIDVEGMEKVSQPSVFLESEEQAIKILRQILGPKPEKDDVIETFKSRGKKLEEISADVVISLARAIGIRTKIVERDIQKFELTPEMVKSAVKDKWKEVAENMPDQEVVSTARIMAMAGWLDENGNPQVEVGTKTQVMTPSDFRDVCRRGANFVETTAETKALKKCILNSLGITSDGLKRKIKETYGWR